MIEYDKEVRISSFRSWVRTQKVNKQSLPSDLTWQTHVVNLEPEQDVEFKYLFVLLIYSIILGVNLRWNESNIRFETRQILNVRHPYLISKKKQNTRKKNVDF